MPKEFEVRILLLGCFVGEEKSSNITISSLFKDISVENIFIAATENEINENLSENRVKNLVSSGQVWNISKNCIFKFDDETDGRLEVKKSIFSKFTNGFKKLLKKKIKDIVLFFEVSDLVIGKKGSVNFYKWVEMNNMKICYSPLSNFYLIKEAKGLASNSNVRFLIHFFDNWVEELYLNVESSFLRRCLGGRRILDSIFLLPAVYLVISEDMKIHYKARFAIESSVFHNLVNIEPGSFHENKSKNKNYLRIGYFGRIGRGNENSLRLFADCVDLYNKNENRSKNVILEVYSKERLSTEDNYSVLFKPFISQSNLKLEMRNCDLLLLPLDSEEESILFIKYSIPTKFTDYASSSVPIISFGPADIAINRLIKSKRLCYFFEPQVENFSEVFEVFEKMPNKEELVLNMMNYLKEELNAEKKREELNTLINSLM
jgi:hypothetical protein